MAQLFKERIKKYLRTRAENKKNGVLGFILLLLSFIYRLILEIRFFLYQSGIFRKVNFGIPVISVGNITAGGTGKTPLVEWIVLFLKNRDKRVSVISRGYLGKRINGNLIADEPGMLKKSFPGIPVLVNKNRIAGIREAQKNYNCECVVLDDAFQNLKIRKSLDIVCVDCRNPFGNGQLLPRGLMRVPFIYLKQADIFVLTHCDFSTGNVDSVITDIRKFNKKALICRSNHAPEKLYKIENSGLKDLSYLKGKKVALFCGIAYPEGLEKTVKDLGAETVLRCYFEDHHFFTEEELANIFEQCRNNSLTTLVTTAKDEPRLKAVLANQFQRLEILVLTVKLKIKENEKRFIDCLDSLFTA